MSGISLYQMSRLSGQADRIPQLIRVVAECLSYPRTHFIFQG
jgi:hypothetical protein